MKKAIQTLQLFVALSLFVAFSTPLAAATFTAISNGDWHDDATWDLGSVPGIADHAVIDGHVVTFSSLSGTLSVGSIEISNATGTGDSYLYITGGSLTVEGNLDAIAVNEGRVVELSISNDAQVHVKGKVEYSRDNANAHNERLRLRMDGTSSLTVDSTFTYYYGDAVGELGIDINIADTSVLEIKQDAYLYLINGGSLTMSVANRASVTVGGNFVMQQSGGSYLTFSASDDADVHFKANVSMITSGGWDNIFSTWGQAFITIDSSLILSSTVSGEDVSVNTNGSESSLEVKGDIVMSAVGAGDVDINMTGGGSLLLGGNFSRPTNFGQLRMAANSQLSYNGIRAQTIARDELAGADTDKFEYTNVIFDNTSGFPLSLEGPMVIADSLVLTNGIIQTDTVNTLTIADGATISGGSTNAYISGPITKEGSTNGGSFIFPVGGGGTYAPIEIGALANASDSYTARYFNCPPPFGNNLAVGLSHISNSEYWTLEKGTGTPDVSVRLHWNDADARGIDDLSSLVVASYNRGSSEWMSLGNGGTTGGIGASISGSVTNDLNCPPPFGNLATMFTFGSTSSFFNSLPVELTSFTAQLSGKRVSLEWETTSEQNNDYFMVERSVDGVVFEYIGYIMAVGNSADVNNYQLFDYQPKNGYNYYRLKQVDRDESFVYSETIVISLENNGTPVVFPNPVGDQLNIYMEGTSQEDVQVEIFNEAGQRLFSRNYPIQPGVFQLSSNELQRLSPGQYTLVLRNKAQTHSLKFLKI